LLDWKELSPEVHHLRFEVRGIEQLHFIPGQFLYVMERDGDKEIARAYSIASPPAGNRFDLCLHRAPERFVSAWLFRLKPGDVVDVLGPSGNFTLRHTRRRAVFIATGTGIAPFRSMLLDHLPRTQPEITLLFGARHQSGLLYRDEFERFLQQYKSFRFLPTLTRPHPEWNGRIGRVQAHLDEALALHDPAEMSNVDVYICGLKEMVDDVRASLKQRGFHGEQIISEKYEDPDEAIADSEPQPEGAVID
jgi:CDP-4-dehydro-6-deoxyglucose reductase, E3